MDALTLLEQDHQKVKKLMGEIEKTTERGIKTREQLFNKLVAELTVHEKIEEQIFYPEVMERATSRQLEELVTESYEEHHVVDIVKAEIETTPSRKKRARCSPRSAGLWGRTSSRTWVPACKN